MGMRTGRMGTALVSFAAAVVSLIIAQPSGQAARVAISPVNIALTSEQHSTLLTLTNVDVQPVRFTVSTFGWSQSETGTMQLAQTSDIIFFPVQLTLASGESRNIRLGTELAPGQNERAYRIILEELPSPEVSTQNHSVQIHVLSRFSIPIFVAPERPTTQADITQIRGSKSALLFRIENTGSVHLPPGTVSVAAQDANAKAIFSKDVNVWYVLAGSTQTVKVAWPASACIRVRSITVSTHIGQQLLKRTQPTPSGACAT